MTVPSLGGITTRTVILLSDDPDGPALVVDVGLIPSPVWKRLCDAATVNAGEDTERVDYTGHAAEFLSAGVARIGDHLTEPVPLDPGDADTIATTYPPHVVNRMLSAIVRANTVGWSNPKG